MNTKIRSLPFLRRMTFASFFIATILLSWNDWAEIQFVAAAEPTAPKAEGVIQLTAKNFDKSLSDGNAWLIEFYAPW